VSSLRERSVSPDRLGVGAPLYAVWHPSLGFYRDNWGIDFGPTMMKSGTFSCPEDAAELLVKLHENNETALKKYKKKYPGNSLPTWYKDNKRDLKISKVVRVSLEVVDLSGNLLT